MQHELHAKALESLQAAAVERDVSQRLRQLQQAQEALLHANVQPATVDSCLDHFLNLQADPHPAVRRYLAHFLVQLPCLKPSLALKCLPAVTKLLKDSDSVVKEFAVQACCALHGRALLLIAYETEALQLQRHIEQNQQIMDQVRSMLADGCPMRPSLFKRAVQWAKVLILAQTPSSTLVKIRLPPEIRGIRCLQDFPDRVAHHVDMNGLRQQAEDLFHFLGQLLDNPPLGRWPCSHLAPLLSFMGSLGRQRPLFLRSILDSWRRLLQEANASLEGGKPQKGSGGLPVAAADVGQLRQLIWAELQVLLASNLTSEWRGEFVELLRNLGVTGSLEELVSQSKTQQICAVLERSETSEADQLARLAAEPPAKKARSEPKLGSLSRVWAGELDAALSNEDAFDGDALASGEVEDTCRRFEDYFGLPSQREPAGYVLGPSLLASRGSSDAALARLALTSLNALSEKRSRLRDRAHERAVVFHEPLVRRSKKGKGDKSEQASGVDVSIEKLLSADRVKEEMVEDEKAAGAAAKDPKVVVLQKLWDRQAAAKAGVGVKSGAATAAATAEGELLLDGTSVQLAENGPARDALQLRFFQELLESQKRMESSLLMGALSPKQLRGFDFASRQVAIHVVASVKLNVNPGLQRSMCKAFMANAFESLKAALDVKGPTAAPRAASALGRLVELFYAKFSTDVARWQDSGGKPTELASLPPGKSTIHDVLETPGQNRRAFTYAELFDIFVSEFEKREVPQKEMRTFLNDIPAVPQSAFKMLESQCQQESARNKSLLTILSLIENKPACRWQGLHLLFKLAYCAGDDSVRFHTIRLIINKIYSAGPHPPMRWQLPHLSEEEAKPQLGPGSEGPPKDAGTCEYISLEKLKGRYVEDVAALMLRSIAPSSAQFAFPVRVPQCVTSLVTEVFKGKVCVPQDRVWLYLALCIKRPVLLHELVEIFTQCDVAMREHLVNSIEEAIKHIPPSEPELLVLVQKATPETERLVLKILHILMQTSQGKAEGLSKAYGEAATRLYGVTQNPKLLVPVFDLLERKDLLDFLPAIVQLDQEEVTNAFQQLIRSKAPPLTISELLTELHHLNKPNENIVPVKFSMQALNIMFGIRSQFDPKVYGIVVQSLVEDVGSLPTLFMRTVIQVVKELPRLSDFIVAEILPRLVRREVWTDESMWRGFMLVLQHTFANQSAGASRVLSMLPMAHLEDVLVQHPDWKAQLRDFAARQPPSAVPPHVRQLLQ